MARDVCQTLVLIHCQNDENPGCKEKQNTYWVQQYRHHENFWAFTGPRRDFGLILLTLKMIIHRRFSGPTHLLSANLRGLVILAVSDNTLPPKAQGCCAIGYPSETHLKLKSRKISFSHNIHFSYPIILKFCRAWQYHCHALCKIFKMIQQLQNTLMIVHVVGNWDFARFEFKLIFGRISHIAQGPWLLASPGHPWHSQTINNHG